ncbi:TPR-like protein [Delitschia confertaspora ATCC 74209]|uniref:TPR-like protein n=1 Tax=Delitschia confertaspora ATCC 74209 TaxID=1513339 RepID=A0A9P4ML42_9PLEO|nr:TPR-like protein [Delitschia confertaspora ATCC 74209]
MFRHDARLFFSQARNISASLSDSTESYPRINDIPQCLLSDRFTGRSEELDIIARTHQTPHSDRPIIFVIYGMSGLGKTQLALKYADVAFRKKEYSFVFWLQASSTAKLHQGFINILNLINHPDRYHSDENVRLTMTRLWLESHSRNPSLRWLLVIDNASTSSIPFLRENLPRNNALGSILLTTQSDVVAKALPASSDHTLQLTIPTTQEAATMFIQEVQRALPQMPLSQSETEDLVMCVGRLPLAVTHAASFMAASQMTLSDILGMYRSDQKLQLLTWDNKLSTYEEKSVATAFKRKFEFLDQHSLHAGNLLRLMSFFDPERIPTDVIIDGLKALKASTCLTKKVETDLPLTTNKRNFRNRVMRYISFQRHGSNGSIKPEEMAKFTRTTAVDRMVDSISETILSPIRLQEALAELQDQSLITRIQSSATLEVQMHDLVKFMVQEMDMILESRTTMLNFASCIVCNAFRLVPDRTSPEAWPKCERIVPHIVSLKNMTHSGTVPELKWATAELAEYFRSRGLYSEAESYYKEALDQSLSASSHPEFLCGLADALVKQGQYDEAEKVCTQGLHGNDLANGNISGHSVTIAAQLVNVYDKQGRYAEAIKLGEWILPKPGRTVDPALSDTLQTMHNMGLAYGHQAQYDKAEEFLTQVLSSNERREGYGPNHPETLRSVNALANLYDRKGQHEEAAKLYMRAIEGREKLFGADHSQTLKSVCGLANLWMRKGLLGEAKELYLRALETSKTHQSCDNPDLLRAVHGLAAVLSFQGNYDESVIQYERVVAGRMAILGAEHADTLRSMEGLAIVYLFTRKLPKARELFEKVLTGRRKCLGENHPETLKTKEDLSYFQQMD